MSFRLPAVGDVDYPALGDLDFGRYDITLAQPSVASVAANGLTSATFADNMSSPVLVRSGPATIPLGSFESNAMDVEAEFSFVFEFDTPYTYTPGDDLVMLVRHDGHGDANGVETRWNFDGYAWENGTVVNTLDVDATDGNFGPGTFNVANRIQFILVPEPSTGMLLAFCGLAGLMLYRRRC
ncbi:PEP-CTERM sorting domain-containing protein [Aeoliella sp. ICT_H6.2]|uniref:PEP-CTERM sorting domain-containing protein n=1 Tax=Aeoliella straminimaris TaxID=2954799 RepID=A0A9X2FE19_9BACT|nr:PEP-CTERM sorting domain-containing protein [Aeoliella straminimaris]MCO6047387.1 PEP-CTERM sorting domain-containing protein [Aeoliella straminimaris]